MTTRELLRVDDLVVGTRGRDGEVRIVDGVSFSVGEGEVLCLVGESGSGKSLTMAAVLGLLPAGVEVLGGSVSYRGRDLLGMPERELRALRGDELAMVFQDPMTALNPVKRVGAQIARAVRLHGERRSADQVERARRGAAALGGRLRSGRASAGVPASVVRRYAPARGHRDGDRP